jgi:hypothetical protein
VYIDPYQGTLMAQRLQRQGCMTVEYPFTGESRRRLFATILDLVRTRRLRSRPHPALRRELLSLEATETAAGWRVDHRPGQHDDHVVAAALAVQAVAGEGTPLTPEMFSVGGFLTTARAAGLVPREALRDERGAAANSEADPDAVWDRHLDEGRSATNRWDSPFD